MLVRQCVITGLGTAVPGVRGPAELLRPDASVPYDDPVTRLTGRGLRYRDRATKLAMCAAADAIEDAGLSIGSGLALPAERVGVVVSTNFGNLDTVCETVAAIAKETYLGTSPMLLPATASNVVASWLAISYGLRGANLTLCNGATSGLDAVHWARLLIASVRHAEPLPIGLWCLPEQRIPVPPPGLERVRTCDLSESLGKASGALGVLQFVAGTSWLETAAHAVLATAGTGLDARQDAAAAMILTPVPESL